MAERERERERGYKGKRQELKATRVQRCERRESIS